MLYFNVLASFANDNDALIPELWARESIAVLEENMVMAMLIHLANLFLHVAEPTIHSLRLNFVEFLPKFYSPEGKNYDPFRKENVS